MANFVSQLSGIIVFHCLMSSVLKPQPYKLCLVFNEISDSWYSLLFGSKSYRAKIMEKL